MPILYKYTVFLKDVKKLLKILKNGLFGQIIDNPNVPSKPGFYDKRTDNWVNNDAG